MTAGSKKRINNMLEQNDSSSEQNKALQEVSTSATKARRGFLKKAAIGAPIVIASSTKPAWGAACMSGIMSGNVSDHTHTCTLQQSGKSHGHWKNHLIGSKNDHWTAGQRPSQWWTKKSEILASLRPKFKHFYVKTGQNYEFSSFKNNSKLEIGGKRFGWLLRNGDIFDREIVTAFINASIPSLGYPYSISDVQEIYDLVQLGDADRTEVGEMLEGIHG